MNFIKAIFGWLAGLLFLLMGLTLLVQSPLGGICMITISFIFLPPVRSFIQVKTGKDLNAKSTIIIAGILFITSMIIVGVEQNTKYEERMAAEAKQEAAKKAKEAQVRQQKNIEHFNENKAEIIAQVTDLIAGKDFQAAVSKSYKYLPSKDNDLKTLYASAKASLDKIREEERIAKKKAEDKTRTDEILSQLKNIPAAKYAENKKLYRELVELNPGVSKYQNKLDHYSTRLAEQQKEEQEKKERQEKKRMEQIAKFGKPPTVNPWNGSYYEVKRYLEIIANDPDSIDISGCTEVYHTKEGWLVGCDYRGNNAFGGKVRQSNWFTIAHGKVIKMHKASAYSPK